MAATNRGFPRNRLFCQKWFETDLIYTKITWIMWDGPSQMAYYVSLGLGTVEKISPIFKPYHRSAAILVICALVDPWIEFLSSHSIVHCNMKSCYFMLKNNRNIFRTHISIKILYMDFLFLKKFELFRNLTSQSDCMEQCRYTHTFPGNCT